MYSNYQVRANCNRKIWNLEIRIQNLGYLHVLRELKLDLQKPCLNNLFLTVCLFVPFFFFLWFCFVLFFLSVLLKNDIYLLRSTERILFTSFFSPAGFTIPCGYWSRMPGHFSLSPPSWTDWRTWPRSHVGIDPMPDRMNLKDLGHAILGHFSTDQMVIESTKISQ